MQFQLEFSRNFFGSDPIEFGDTRLIAENPQDFPSWTRFAGRLGCPLEVLPVTRRVDERAGSFRKSGGWQQHRRVLAGSVIGKRCDHNHIVSGGQCLHRLLRIGEIAEFGIQQHESAGIFVEELTHGCTSLLEFAPTGQTVWHNPGNPRANAVGTFRQIAELRACLLGNLACQ